MNKIFGDNALYQFLGMHTEKIVLGLAGLMVLLFIYMGTSQQGLPDDPKDLQQQVAMTQQRMNDTNVWKSLEPDRLPKVDFSGAGKGFAKTDGERYNGSGGIVPFDPPLSQPQTRRTDPELQSPFDLQVKSGSGAVAYAIDPRLGIKPPIRPQNPNPLVPQEAPQVIPESFRAAKVMGYRPTDQDELKGAHFVALTALVPYRKQVEEYDIAFKQAMGYDPRRDTPRYLAYRVQRTEVSKADEQPVWPDSPIAKDPKFSTFLITSLIKGEPAKWATPVADVVDPKHLDLELTMQPLPLVLRDLNSFLMHPRVERMKPSDFVPEAQPEVAPPMGEDPLGLEPAAPIPNPMNPALPKQPPRVNPGVGPRVNPGPIHGPGGGRPIGPGNVGGPGMLNSNEPPPEFKLLRFFDTNVEPGKMYKYRVQVWLEDANDPKPAPAPAAGGPGGQQPVAGEFLPAPAVAHLKDEVIERIKQRRLDEVKLKRRIYYRETKWSEPSPAIEVPSTTVLLAGSVTQAAENEVWRHAEPKGKVVARLFVPKALVPGFETVKPEVTGPRDIAGELEVKRSSVINFEEDGAALEPVRLEIEKHLKYPFVTHATVLDLRGGEKVPLSTKPKEIKEAIDGIGEMLIMDAHGNLLVRSEADDAEDYKDSLLQFEKKGPVIVPNNNGGVPNIPGFPGIPGDGFIPGGEGPRKPR